MTLTTYTRDHEDEFNESIRADIRGHKISSNASLFSPQAMLRLLGVVLLLRVVFILIAPLDLISDEAYYWDWSRRIDYCYFSKPPMIAWINFVSTGILGSSTFAVRLPAAVLGTMGLLLVYLLGSKLFSPKIGFWAAILMMLTPGNCVLSLVMTIDAPLLFFWVVAMYAYWMSLHAENDRDLWWLLKVVAIGLGLLSKQTMIAFLPMSILYLIITPQDNKEARKPRFILGNLLSLTVLLPMVYWNGQHNWVTVQHTASHFSNRATTVGESLKYGFEFMFGQMGVVTPVLWVAIIAMFIICVRAAMDLSKEEKFLISFSLPGFLVVMFLSFRQRMEPNWPAVFYPAAILLATAMVFRVGEVFGRKRLLSGFRPALLTSAVAFCMFTYLVPMLSPLTANSGASWDLTSRLRGWSLLADKYEKELAFYQIDPKTPIIGQSGRSVVSELAFYLDHQPKIVLWNETGEIDSQYDLWRENELPKTSQAIVITEKSRPVSANLVAQFGSVRSISEIVIPLGKDKARTYSLWLLDSPARMQTAVSPTVVSPGASTPPVSSAFGQPDFSQPALWR